MTRVTFYLSGKQLAALKALAKETGICYSELIRRAVDEFLKNGAK